jgi:hypothetical protein
LRKVGSRERPWLVKLDSGGVREGQGRGWLVQ